MEDRQFQTEHTRFTLVSPLGRVGIFGSLLQMLKSGPGWAGLGWADIVQARPQKYRASKYLSKPGLLGFVRFLNPMFFGLFLARKSQGPAKAGPIDRPSESGT